MNNASWIGGFLERHISRVPRYDWPDGQSEYWESWQLALGELKATERECDAASRVLAAAPPTHLGRQLEALLNAIRVARETAALDASGTTRDRKEAEARSRGCPECGGGGMTSRWRWVARWDRYVSVGMICHRCEHGRWIEDAWRGTPGPKPPALSGHPEWQDEELKYGPPVEVGW